MFTLPAYVGIVLMSTSQVLLVKRHNTDWAAGNWNFPGGLLEEHETLREAAAREALEEVGVTIQPEDLELVHVLQVRASESNTKNIIGFYFIATKWQGTAHNCEPHRHSDAQWFAIDALPEYITSHALQALGGLQHGIHYSEN